MMIIDNGFNTVWEKSFAGFSITAANVIKNKYPVVALFNNEAYSRDRHHLTTIQIYNQNDTENSPDIDAKVTGIVSKENCSCYSRIGSAFY